MTKEVWHGITVLVADDGAWITDGETFSKRVYLGKNADENDWRDASEAEYEYWLNYEPVTEDEALTRFANELTGAQDDTLTEATESLIKTVMEVNYNAVPYH